MRNLFYTKTDIREKSSEEIQADHQATIIQSIISSDTWSKNELDLLYKKLKADLKMTRDFFDEVLKSISKYGYIDGETKLEKLFNGYYIKLEIIDELKKHIQGIMVKGREGWNTIDPLDNIKLNDELKPGLAKIKSEYEGLRGQAIHEESASMESMKIQLKKLEEGIKKAHLEMISGAPIKLGPLLEKSKLF